MRFVPGPGRDSIGKFITGSGRHRRAGTGGCALRIKPTFLQSEGGLSTDLEGFRKRRSAGGELAQDINYLRDTSRA